MTEQCAIYLDPWDKTDLEGTAMLIGRMPDITNRLYRGVTCQRWFVRFLPDQDIIFRWLDYGDAEAYVYPIQDSFAISFGLRSITINDASPALSFPKSHAVDMDWWATLHKCAVRIPQAAGYFGMTITYTVTAATGGASLTALRIRKNDTGITGYNLSASTTAGGPYAGRIIHPTPYPLADPDMFTVGLSGPQPADESVTLTNILITTFIAWGDFT